MNFEDYRILLVDDEKSILDMNERLLKDKGFKHIEKAENAGIAEDKVSSEKIHLVVLDIMMPGMDGLSLYEKWVNSGKNIPVIFLSARDEEASRLKGLGLGADDYVTKPYTPEELYLRIKAVLRRTYHATDNKMILLGKTKIDLASGTVLKDKEELILTAKEHAILTKLYDNQGKIVSINALLDTLWPDGSYGLENSLVVHIRRLREKIEDDPSKPKYIQTLRGLGYRLKGEESR